MEIDWSKLNRNYKTNPLKYGELPDKEDLIYLYLKLNLSANNISKIINRNPEKIRSFLKLFNIIKTKEQISKSTRATCLYKYGESNVMRVPEFREKHKESVFKNLGVFYPCQSPQVMQKLQNNLKSKTGFTNAMQIPEIKEQRKQDSLKKCGKEWYMETKEFRQRAEQTWQNNFGETNPTKCSRIKQKQIDTLKENWFGVDKVCYLTSFCSVDKFIDKYGIEVLEKVERKRKQELSKFGNDMKAIIKYLKDDYHKKREIALKKAYETKKRNHTFGTSKQELQILEKLINKFPEVIHHPDPTIKYPFIADFYIPELDLYIEYQGYASHGTEPFNSQNPKHIELIETWKNKANEINFKNQKKVQFLNWIDTWTKRDLNKRKTAKENNLNWLEFFTMQQFLDWYTSIGK